MDGRALVHDVDWDTVAARMGSRNAAQCRTKWCALAPTMVEAGEWAAGEDRVFLRALLAAGDVEEWQLDWGSLVEARARCLACLPARRAAAPQAGGRPPCPPPLYLTAATPLIPYCARRSDTPPQGRTETAARRRWRTLLPGVPGARELRFARIVRRLVKTFCPSLLRAQTAAAGGDAAAPAPREAEEEEERRRQRQPAAARKRRRDGEAAAGADGSGSGDAATESQARKEKKQKKERRREEEEAEAAPQASSRPSEQEAGPSGRGHDEPPRPKKRRAAEDDGASQEAPAAERDRSGKKEKKEKKKKKKERRREDDDDSGSPSPSRKKKHRTAEAGGGNDGGDMRAADGDVEKQKRRKGSAAQAPAA